jgi:uncharacterized membrane protein (Fun14 family)
MYFQGLRSQKIALGISKRGDAHKFMNIDIVGSTAATIGGGFFAGILLGFALKKVIKIVAVIVGLFLAGLFYLQSQQIATIKWDKIEEVSEGAIITLANATTMIGSNNNNNDIGLAISNFGGIMPLAGSMSAGFTIGFLKG